MININIIREGLGYCSKVEKFQLLEAIKRNTIDQQPYLNFKSINCFVDRLFKRFSYQDLFSEMKTYRNINDTGNYFTFKFTYKDDGCEVNIRLEKI